MFTNLKSSRQKKDFHNEIINNLTIKLGWEKEWNMGKGSVLSAIG